MRLKSILIIIFILPIIIFASFAKPTDLLDVPTAEVMNNGKLSGALFFSVASKYSEDKVPFDYNFSISYGLMNILDFTLNMFTFTDYTLGVQYNFLKSTPTIPSLSFGIRNITYKKYIDEGGGGDSINSGFMDYAYPERAQDWFSAYIVATKDFKKFGKYTLGIGRGEFVGYSRGIYLSTAVFMDDQRLLDGATNYMFGLFGGAEIPIIKGLNFLGEVTGRDINMGLEYKIRDFDISGGLTHVELFMADDPTLSPRMAIGMNCGFDFGFLKKQKKDVKKGFVVINIINESDDEPVDGMIEFLNVSLPPIFIEEGNRKIELPSGKYKLKAMSDECEVMIRDVEVRAEETKVIFFNMEGIEKCGTLTGRMIDRTTEKPVFPKIEIEDIESDSIAVDKSTGMYKIDLMPGTYTIRAKLEEFADWIYHASIEESKATIMNIDMLKKGGRVSLKNVNFKSGSSNLTKESFPILDDAVLVLTANSSVKIEIQGFTDDIGDANANLILSKERAESVKDYIVFKGIDEKRIQTKGFGETMNIADNESKKNRAKNRRIEFIILSQ